MQAFQNPFEGIIFPQFRKYKNGKSYFKINSPVLFEEKMYMGSKILWRQYEAKILPDRNFVLDLLTNFNDFAEEIKAEEYDALPISS